MDNDLWVYFLTNFLGIVLGIVLTFGVNSLWHRHQEKRRAKDILTLVRNELLNNKEILHMQETLLKKDALIYKEILAARKDLGVISSATLGEYYTQIQNVSISPLNTSAWQIFQNSEVMQRVTSTEIVIRLTSCYSVMTTWQDFITVDYWQAKRNLLVLAPEEPLRFFEEVLKNRELVSFCEMFRLDKEDIWEAFRIIDATIDYVIMLLDKHGHYQYDMADRDKDFEEYLRARLSPKTASDLFNKESIANEGIKC